MVIERVVRIGFVAAALCILPLVSTDVHAQGIDASIVGQVTDQSGSVLPGVTVTAASPVLQVQQVVVVTDARGEYRLSGLPIGTYGITFGLEGFRTVRREGVRLTAGFTAKIDIVMGLGAVAETITVAGSSPIVDVTSTTSTTTLTREALEVLPTNRDGVVAILVQTPGVRTLLDVGGNTMGDVPQMHSYGRDAQNWTLMEGVLAGSQTPRASGLYQDYSTLENVTVSTFAHDASVGVPGVALTTAVKSGGNTFHGDITGSFTGSSLKANNVSPELVSQGVSIGAPILQRNDFGGTFGGKIVKDRLWFQLGARQRANDNGTLNCLKSQGSGPDNTGGGRHSDYPGCENDATTRYYSGKLSYQASPSNRFITYYQYNLKDVLGRDTSALVRWTYRQHQYQPGALFKAEWTRTLGSKAVMEVNYGYWDANAQNVDAGYNPTNSTRDLVTGVIDGDRSGGYVLFARNQAHGKVSWLTPTGRLGSHNFTAGWDLFLARIDEQTNARQSGAYTLLFRNGVPFELTTSNEPFATSDKDFYMPLYVQDQWRITPQMTLNLGVRFSHELLYIPEQSRVAGQFAPAQTFPTVDFAAWNWVVPRIHLAYDLTNDGRTVIKGGWARYAWTRDIQVARATNRNLNVSNTFLWHDLNGDKLYQPGEVNLDVNGPDFVSQAGTNTQIPNPNEAPPIDDEFSVSLEREVIRGLSARVTGIYLRETNVPRLLNTLIPYAAYNIPITRPIPAENGVVPPGAPLGTLTYYEFPVALRGLQFQAPTIVNDPRATTTYATVELGLSKRLSNRWMMQSSFAATKINQPFIPYLGGYSGFGRGDGVQTGALDPNQEINSANSAWEWTAKFGGSYEFPWGVLASTNYQLLGGAPWGRTVLFTGGVTIPSIVVRVEPIGTRHYPNINELDVRLGKKFTLFNRHKVEALLEAYNLPNLSTVGSTNSQVQSQVIQSGPTFGQPLSILPARTVQFGFRYSF